MSTLISFLKVADAYISVRHIKSVHVNPEYTYNLVVMQSGRKFNIAPVSYSQDWGYGGSEGYVTAESKSFLEQFAQTVQVAQQNDLCGYHSVFSPNTEWVKFEHVRAIDPTLPTEWSEMDDYLDGIDTAPSIPSAIVPVSPVVDRPLPPFEVTVAVFYHKDSTELVYNLLCGLDKYGMPKLLKQRRFMRPASPVREEKNGWGYGSETYKWIKGGCLAQ